MAVRCPVISVLGHVDHGKTLLLDKIRGTAVADKEAGKITQAIGATEVPLDTIKSICGSLLDRFKVQFNIPGLLFIDTPGHEAFTSLRRRGGSISDLAILIIDINQGVQPQTKEAIEIIKTFKVPFVIAASKVDIVPNWKTHSKIFIENIAQQTDLSREEFEKRIYRLMGAISELGFSSNLYNKIEDYQKEIAIIPTSGKTGEGIAELLALLTGLSQKFLEKNLNIEVKGPAKGTVLEIKETEGLGTTADVIIYDGTLSVGEEILIGGLDDIVKTKVKALLKPSALSEIRDSKTRFTHVKSVTAATGIKISALDLDKVNAGSPVVSIKAKDAEKEIRKELEEVKLETQDKGVIIKADTLGSLEAFLNILEQNDIPVKKARIGNVNKKDIADASASMEKDPFYGVILGFNVKCDDTIARDANKCKVDVVTHPVIYKVLEEYQEKCEKKRKQMELEELEGVKWPAKIKSLSGYVFRQSNPAIFGVEVMAGELRNNVDVMNENGTILGEIKTIESEGNKLDSAKTGEKVAIALMGPTFGRQIKEGDTLIVSVPESDFKKLKKKKNLLCGAEISLLQEIARIKRKTDEMWGV
ncbi:MAG: translation initiation factor IF-2 [Candidatus Woesearchaeota archaeon]|nr:MAG: translation initiation factor IF-2 [Candidatus Woesearchaeota archaeon]